MPPRFLGQDRPNQRVTERVLPQDPAKKELSRRIVSRKELRAKMDCGNPVCVLGNMQNAAKIFLQRLKRLRGTLKFLHD
jgi:hypothetical protein